MFLYYDRFTYKKNSITEFTLGVVVRGTICTASFLGLQLYHDYMDNTKRCK